MSAAGRTAADLKALVTRTDLQPEQKTPLVLSKLQDLLRRASVQDGAELEAVKRELLRDGVLEYCADSLSLNYAKVRGGYATAALMAEVLSSCCVGVKPAKDGKAFHRRFLPSVTNSLLSLANQLMNRAFGDHEQPEMLRLSRKVMDSLCWLLKGHNHLASQALESKLYEKIQMKDDQRVRQMCLSLWEQVLSCSSEWVADLRRDSLACFLDDVVFDLTDSPQPAVGGAAIRVLILVARQQGHTLQFIMHRFRGLDVIVEKEWRGRGLDQELDELINLLHTGDQQPAQTRVWSQECVRAACVIQATWRSYLTRRRVKKLPRAVSTLQRSFRERRSRREQQAQEQRAQEELRLQVCERRQRSRREFHQRQLHLLQLLPPGQAQRYLGEVERQAALVIQRVWRGHRERRSFQQRKHTLTQHRAASVLQRAVLRFLKKRRVEKAPPLPSPWIGPQGLTDRRRAELKRQVDEYIALHPSSIWSAEGAVELHGRAQAELLKHLQGREAERRAQTHTQALLAQINTDLELLMNAPALSAASPSDWEAFRSRSAPVGARARQSHNALLQAAKLPWWRMLGDDDDAICLDSDSTHARQLEREADALYEAESREKRPSTLL